MKSKTSTALLAVLVCLVWSTAFAFVKIGLEYVPPLLFAGMRYILAGLILVPFWLRINSPLRSVRDNLRLVLLVALLQTILNYGVFFIAMQFISGALGAIIMGAFPIVAAIVSHFSMKNDRMSVKSVLSLSAGMAGIIIISLSREPWTATGLRELIGIALILITCVSSAFSHIVVVKDRKGLDPILLISAQMLIGGIVLFFISISFEGAPVFVLPLKFYLSLLWLAAVSAFGFSIWFLLLKRPGVTVSGLNIWMFIIPVFGAVLSWIIIPEEYPTLFPVLGMICVAVSLVTYTSIKKSAGVLK